MSLKLAIITPSFNQGHYIRDTIESVLRQDYPHWEHIVVDGGSTDSTIEVLKSYSHLKWVSEKDSGQSNAINKGFSSTDADIIAWINSDDYYGDNVFATIMAAFEANPRVSFVYGDLTYVDPERRVIGVAKGDGISREQLSRNPDIVRQPSTFFRRRAWESLGRLREDLDLVFDYDFFLRGTRLGPYAYVPCNISFYRHYPATKSMSRSKYQATEILRVAVSNRAVSLRLVRLCLLRMLGLEIVLRGWLSSIRAYKWNRRS